jgi:hypothetical protein
LDSDLSKEEFFVALSSMKNGMSSRLDGLLCEFYKAMWDMIGNDFCCSMAKAFSSKILIESPNQGLIKLITKNMANDTNGGWKTITLLNVAYKIMAEAMALQIFLVAQKEVHQE